MASGCPRRRTRPVLRRPQCSRARPATATGPSASFGGPTSTSKAGRSAGLPITTSRAVNTLHPSPPRRWRPGRGVKEDPRIRGSAAAGHAQESLELLGTDVGGMVVEQGRGAFGTRTGTRQELALAEAQVSWRPDGPAPQGALRTGEAGRRPRRSCNATRDPTKDSFRRLWRFAGELMARLAIGGNQLAGIRPHNIVSSISLSR